jgi:hypothetical protein
MEKAALQKIMPASRTMRRAGLQSHPLSDSLRSGKHRRREIDFSNCFKRRGIVAAFAARSLPAGRPAILWSFDDNAMHAAKSAANPSTGFHALLKRLSPG